MTKIASVKTIFIELFLALGLLFSCSSGKTGNISIYHPDHVQTVSRDSTENTDAVSAPIQFDDTAKFISGIPNTSGPLKTLQETESWKNYADSIAKSWTDLETKRLKPMKAWAESELSEADSNTKLLFYPFSGPDFLTAFLLFPTADTYILLGLEPVGNLPEWEKETPSQVGSYLEDIKIALSDFFKKSYFITKNMIEALQTNKVDGVLPLICFFLKRADNSISSLKRIELDDEGNILETPYETLKKRMKRPYGIKINFVTNESRNEKTVYYFSCDLSDEKFQEKSKFFAFLNKIQAMTTFIKSASYILHYRNFSNIRNQILAKSQFILQDDTGIPYRCFQEKMWEITLYGEYAKPVKEFSNLEQPELKAAYQDKSKVKKLTFHLGYHWGSQHDTIMYLKRKVGNESSH
jgi:hypothetical protein